MVSLVVVAAAASRAAAQPASAQAQSLFDEGRKLLAAGKLPQACAAFESSQKLDPAVTTLLNLADCREQNHQLATAWGLFVDANRLARTANNDKLAKVASNHAHKLEPRLSKLAIAVPADSQVAGLEVRRDNELVLSAAWNHALPIDGGTYTITASAPGHAPWSATTTIKVEADNASITVPVLPEARPVAVQQPLAPPSAGDAPQSTAGVARTADAPSKLPVVPLVVGGGALILAGAAIAFDLSGNRLYDRAKAAGSGPGDSLYQSANTRRYLAEGFGVAALGAAGAAVYLYVAGRGDGRPDTTALTPVASPQLTGLAVVGTW
jgi:hypothetical protein